MIIKNNKKFFLILFLIICIYILTFFVNFNDNNQKDENILANFNNTDADNIGNNNVKKISISACTGDVVQEECYSDFPKPILNWDCELEGEKSDNYFFMVQVDDSGDFIFPEFDSGEIETSDLFYKIEEAGLKFDVSYNWRIKVENSVGEWSDWATADEAFVTSPKCE